MNYNTSEFILKSIFSLRKHNIDFDYEIIIVDNNSQDLHNLNKLDHNARVIKILNKENLGFGAACNIGTENSKFDNLLFVNPDILFNENPFPPIENFILANSNTGVIGGVLLNADNSFQYSYNNFPDYKWEISELFGSTNSLIKKKLDTIQKKPIHIDWMIGAFMFMKKDVFLKAGGFDEDYFLYYEDTDLQKKISDLGYQNYLLPSVKILHGTKSSIKGEEGNKVYNLEMNKSKMIYLYKHTAFLKRNIIRLINILRILSRMFIFPLKYILRKSHAKDFAALSNNFKIYLHMQKFYFNGK